MTCKRLVGYSGVMPDNGRYMVEREYSIEVKKKGRSIDLVKRLLYTREAVINSFF